MNASSRFLSALVSVFPEYLKNRLPRDIRLVEIQLEESRRLNCAYRAKNKAAQVLSFRYGGAYGEILFCPSAARKEAAKEKCSYASYRVRVLVHGLLHLAGVHHEKSERRAHEAERLEEKIVERFLS